MSIKTVCQLAKVAGNTFSPNINHYKPRFLKLPTHFSFPCFRYMTHWRRKWSYIVRIRHTVRLMACQELRLLGFLFFYDRFSFLQFHSFHPISFRPAGLWFYYPSVPVYQRPGVHKTTSTKNIFIPLNGFPAFPFDGCRVLVHLW